MTTPQFERLLATISSLESDKRSQIETTGFVSGTTSGMLARRLKRKKQHEDERWKAQPEGETFH
tara:strand:- start:40945 stop:41136 length:192 start_codon:yes stop_codon:yes gene_type:complete